MKPRNDLTVIDLFAGCGGLALGLEQAGFQPLYVNELNDDARETYLCNRDYEHPLLRKKYHSADIATVMGKHGFFEDLLDGFRRDYTLGRRNDPIDLVVGGPPCQGYSSVGIRRSYRVDKKHLPSNHLYMHMSSFIERLRPRAFLFENVEGLLYSRWTKNGKPGEIFADVFAEFSRIPDYVVKHKLIYAKDYGVPQNRPRVLIVGFRADVFQGTTDSDALLGGFLPHPVGGYPSVPDVLSDLVDPNFEYGGKTTKYATRPSSEFQSRMRTDNRDKRVYERVRLHEHEYSRHSARIQKKFMYMIENQGRIHHSHATKKFRQRVLPREWGTSGPSITITSLPDDFVHYVQPRSLTVRECARIQTFPDWYEFRGPRTTGGLRRAGNPVQSNFTRSLPKYTQIANAVPVDLAKAIGSHLASILRR